MNRIHENKVKRLTSTETTLHGEGDGIWRRGSKHEENRWTYGTGEDHNYHHHLLHMLQLLYHLLPKPSSSVASTTPTTIKLPPMMTPAPQEKQTV